uniref:Uncharacterized protein n=1 Tax=Arundo donax TaxID=35708 RepID=A0A0A8YPQ2_ARUDO
MSTYLPLLPPPFFSRYTFLSLPQLLPEFEIPERASHAHFRSRYQTKPPCSRWNPRPKPSQTKPDSSRAQYPPDSPHAQCPGRARSARSAPTPPRLP